MFLSHLTLSLSLSLLKIECLHWKVGKPLCYLASNGTKIFFFLPNLRISVSSTSSSDDSELSSRTPQFFFSLCEFAHLYTKFLQTETWDL